jgi:hypothetical protein
MKQHRYRVTLERLSEPTAPSDSRTLQFEAANHDDVFAIVERLRGRGDFDHAAAAAFVVGLKLFGEVMLEQHANPLFSTFKPHFLQFMKQLKQRSTE